jgi:hypothetical protein
MKYPIGKVKMIINAKCTRFSILNRHVQLVNTTVKKAKVEEIHINGNHVMILKQKYESLISQFSFRWERNKVLMGSELFYFNQD